MSRSSMPRDDKGFTLVETLVAIVVMGAFLTVFGRSIVSMFGSSNQTQAVANTATQVNDAFLWLDRHVRYASFVSQPGQDSADGNYYVEFEDANTSPATCYQLRVDAAAGQLQQRSWVGAGAVTAWSPLANGVHVGADAPFGRTRAAGAVPMIQLTVDVLAQQGVGEGTVGSQSSVTFTALNTDAETPVSGLCMGMRP